MRAVYLKESFENKKQLVVVDEVAHHLNVVRAKIKEEILVINGMGLSAITEVLSLTKREVVLEIIKIEQHQPKHQILIAIAMPKKDAFEDILKMATELGVAKIYPLTSKYSQYNFKHSDRIDRLVESALIQSNNMYLPEIQEEQKLESFLKSLTLPLVYFSSRPIESKIEISKMKECVILIGPEGGFSPEEESEILKYGSINQIHLRTPILRAPTAVATSIGYLLSL